MRLPLPSKYAPGRLVIGGGLLAGLSFMTLTLAVVGDALHNACEGGFGSCLNQSGDTGYQVVIVGALGLLGLGFAVAVVGLYWWAWQIRRRVMAVVGVTLLIILVVWRFIAFVHSVSGYRP
jgi:hypothetical protein